MYNRRLQIVFEVSRIAWNSFNLQDFSWIHARFGLDLAHSWKELLCVYEDTIVATMLFQYSVQYNAWSIENTQTNASR